MTVEEVIRGKLGDENDRFPVGMRVLAVDDDMTCLKLLERLLQKCQYQVTTTNQAKVALNMLRENRNRFDIIITDVHMPDMDGLKLLELVGLEMDLPVIMLSVNSDPKLVMKGITHGACDYLVKPVRLEELKNIWQHVIRKKKREPKQQNNDQLVNLESGNGTCSNNSSDKNNKRSNRKRKEEEHEDEDDEEGDENGSDSDEPGTQKKPRVIWSMDLHKKFVLAVNQLGIGKGAVPKRILKHMNVEGLTRENVASHLQKYRLYLKRINSAATQEKDPFMQINLFDRVGDLRSRYSTSVMPSYQTGSLLNRLNKPSGGNLLGSSSMIQANNLSQNISNSFSTLTKFDPIQNSNQFQMISKPSEFNQTSKNNLYSGNINFISSSFNNLSSAQNKGILSNQSSEPINASAGPYNNGLFSNFSSNPGLFSEAFNRNTLVPSDIIENNSSLVGHIRNNPLDFSSIDVISKPVHDLRGEGLFGHFKNTNNVVPVNGITSPFSDNFDQNNIFSQRKTEMPSMNLQNNGLPSFLQQNGSEKVPIEPKTKPDRNYFMEQWKSQSGFGSIGYDALDELLNSVTKEDQEGNMVIDGEFGIDAYTS